MVRTSGQAATRSQRHQHRREEQPGDAHALLLQRRTRRRGTRQPARAAIRSRAGLRLDRGHRRMAGLPAAAAAQPLELLVEVDQVVLGRVPGPTACCARRARTRSRPGCSCRPVTVDGRATALSMIGWKSLKNGLAATQLRVAVEALAGRIERPFERAPLLLLGAGQIAHQIGRLLGMGRILRHRELLPAERRRIARIRARRPCGSTATPTLPLTGLSAALASAQA